MICRLIALASSVGRRTSTIVACFRSLVATRIMYDKLTYRCPRIFRHCAPGWFTQLICKKASATRRAPPSISRCTRSTPWRPAFTPAAAGPARSPGIYACVTGSLAAHVPAAAIFSSSSLPPPPPTRRRRACGRRRRFSRHVRRRQCVPSAVASAARHPPSRLHARPAQRSGLLPPAAAEAAVKRVRGARPTARFSVGAGHRHAARGNGSCHPPTGPALRRPCDFRWLCSPRLRLASGCQHPGCGLCCGAPPSPTRSLPSRVGRVQFPDSESPRPLPGQLEHSPTGGGRRASRCARWAGAAAPADFK